MGTAKRVNEDVLTLGEVEGEDLIPLVQVDQDGLARGASLELTTLRAFVKTILDIHEDLGTELTALANADRLGVSDESANGDPTKWIQAQNVAKYVWERYVMILTEDPTQSDINSLPDKGVIIVRATTAFVPA